MILVITETHTHTVLLLHCLHIKLRHPVCQSRRLDIYIQAHSIPHTPLSDSHIIQCRKSCSSFINIRPCSQKTRRSQQKNTTARDREYSSSLGREGWLWGNCRLFAQARQCCVCLLLKAPASWLPLHCHRTEIMDSQAFWRGGGGNNFFFCTPPPGLILVCLGVMSLSRQSQAKSSCTHPQLRAAMFNTS